ncbi:MAG TPA: hypothetical protein VGX92_12225 [Pyrinomonadaceae bacterium]|nr:hypothetical protein [Pyrinomonadaceae bacterium]
MLSTLARDRRPGNTVALKETFFEDETMLKAFARPGDRPTDGTRAGSLPVTDPARASRAATLKR